MLAVLAASSGAAYTPVQAQKLFFLLDKKIPKLVGGPHFNFRAMDYGPFDGAVYDELRSMAPELVQTEERPAGRWQTYRLTDTGQMRGACLLKSLRPDVVEYIRNLSQWIRAQSFADLVSAIYAEYPEMRQNSVFRG